MNNKILAIKYYCEQYYEPTLEIEVIDKEKKPDYCAYDNWEICEDVEAYQLKLIAYSDCFEKYLKLGLTAKDISEVHSFYNIVQNYLYLQELKSKSYDLERDLQFRQIVYGDEGGYGEFRQEIIVFGALSNICLNSTDFKKLVIERLTTELPEMVCDDNRSLIIENLQKHLAETQKQIDSYEGYINQYKKELERLTHQKETILADLQKWGKDEKGEEK